MKRTTKAEKAAAKAQRIAVRNQIKPDQQIVRADRGNTEPQRTPVAVPAQHLSLPDSKDVKW